MSSHHPHEPADSSGEEAEDSGRSSWARAGIVAVFGGQLAGFIIGAVLLGRHVDQQFETGPFGVLVGLFAALAAAGVHLWKLATRFLDTSDSTSEPPADA